MFPLVCLGSVYDFIGSYKNKFIKQLPHGNMEFGVTKICVPGSCSFLFGNELSSTKKEPLLSERDRKQKSLRSLLGVEIQLGWWSTCLASKKPWAHSSPAPQTPGAVVQAWSVIQTFGRQNRRVGVQGHPQCQGQTGIEETLSI